jgi:hypothetical protein
MTENSKLPIAIDFDGVINEPMVNLCRELNVEYGLNLRIEDIVERDWRRLFGLYAPYGGELWNRVFNKWSTLVQGAAYGVQQLHLLGYPLVVCTARSGKDVLFAQQVSKGIGYIDEVIDGAAARKRQWAAVLDDDPHKVARYFSEGNCTRRFLLSKPWNERGWNLGKLEVVHNWPEFIARIEMGGS